MSTTEGISVLPVRSLGLGSITKVLKQNAGQTAMANVLVLPRRPCVSMDAVRSRLGGLAQPGTGWRSKQICVPIALPAGVDTEATRDTLVAELERIAKLIDPDGPTYREAR